MTTLALDYSRLGVVVSSYDVLIEPDSVEAFAEATNDASTFHAGDPAPPVFGVVPTRPAVLAALRAAIPAEVSAGVPVLHGEHDMTWRRPLCTGETVRVSGTPVGVEQKGSGTLVLLRIDTADYAGEPIGRQHLTIFLPRWSGERTAGEPMVTVEAVAAGDRVARTSVATTTDQSRRYGMASGDVTAFHMDDDAARSYGFEGVIMHGLCSLALAVNAIATELGRQATDVRRLAARFTSPACPGDDLVSTYWTGPARQAAVIGFSTRAQDGRSVLDRGRIEFMEAVTP